MNQPNLEFKNKLERRMNELGMKPSELIRKSGLNHMSVYNYLSGKSRPLNKSLDALTKALGVSREYFLRDDPEISVKQDTVVNISDKFPSSPVSSVPSNLEPIIREIIAIFQKHNLSFKEVFEVLSTLKKHAMKQAIEATKDMPYQGGGL